MVHLRIVTLTLRWKPRSESHWAIARGLSWSCRLHQHATGHRSPITQQYCVQIYFVALTLSDTKAEWLTCNWTGHWTRDNPIALWPPLWPMATTMAIAPLTHKTQYSWLCPVLVGQCSVTDRHCEQWPLVEVRPRHLDGQSSHNVTEQSTLLSLTTALVCLKSDPPSEMVDSDGRLSERCLDSYYCHGRFLRSGTMIGDISHRASLGGSVISFYHLKQYGGWNITPVWIASSIMLDTNDRRCITTKWKHQLGWLWDNWTAIWQIIVE